MATCIKEWYPDAITCLQVYYEFHDSFFGTINGVEQMETWSRDKDTTAQLLQEYYDKSYGNLEYGEIYVVLGGSQENMEKRATKVFEMSRYNDHVVLSGLPSEVKWMQDFFEKRNIQRNIIIGNGSWDTLSNIQEDVIPSIMANTDNIVIPTGHAHGTRVQKIWKYFYEDTIYKKIRLETPYSGESDGDNEKIINLFYKFKIGIIFLSWVASGISQQVLRVRKSNT